VVFEALEQAEIKAIAAKIWYFLSVKGLAISSAIYGFSTY
jgi:hypothetical protein